MPGNNQTAKGVKYQRSGGKDIIFAVYEAESYWVIAFGCSKYEITAAYQSSRVCPTGITRGCKAHIRI